MNTAEEILVLDDDNPGDLNEETTFTGKELDSSNIGIDLGLFNVVHPDLCQRKAPRGEFLHVARPEDQEINLIIKRFQSAIKAKLLNMSETGIGFECQQDLEVGEEFEFKINLINPQSIKSKTEELENKLENVRKTLWQSVVGIIGIKSPEENVILEEIGKLRETKTTDFVQGKIVNQYEENRYGAIFTEMKPIVNKRIKKQVGKLRLNKSM